MSIAVGNYQDLFYDKVTNDAVYAFWRKKVAERVKDSKKRELLAPAVPPHPIGCKRPCLEQYFYEIFNQDNVDLVDINASPILEITPKGVKTTEKEYEFDVLVLATGVFTPEPRTRRVAEMYIHRVRHSHWRIHRCGSTWPKW